MAYTSTFNCFTGALTGTKNRSGRKRGLSAVGSGFTFGTNYVYTQAQAQSIVNDQNPWYWYTYLVHKNGVVMPRGTFIPYFGNDMRDQANSLTPFNQTNIDLAVAQTGPGGAIFFGGEIDLVDGGGNPTLANLITDWTTLANDPGVIANNIRLISPTLGSTVSSNDKLVQFVNGVSRKPDGIRIDIYDGNLAHTGPSVLANFYAVGGRIKLTQANFPGQPLWISEFGTNAGTAPSDAWFADMQDYVCTAFEADDNIAAYFQWYGGPATVAAAASYPYRYLYDDRAVATPGATHYKNNGG